jgi:hypothetical protein
MQSIKRRIGETLKSTMLKNKKYHHPGCFEPEKIKRKVIDGRRRNRKAPVQHPWRQYKLTRGALLNKNEIVSIENQNGR